MSVLQIDPQPWPTGDGRPIAVIALTPEDLKGRFGLSFIEDYDDLDYYVLAAVRRPAGGQLWFMRHRNSPRPGTVIYADASVSPCRAVAEVVEMLRIKASEVLWVNGEE